MSSWDYYPKEFSSYEEYIKYLKEQGLAIEAPQGLAIEAPKKIYLQEPTKVRTEKLYNNDVEYVQTDVFIEKACTFLKNRTMPELCLDSESTELVDDFIETFKNYMKENKSMKDKEMAELLAGAYQRQYHHNTYPELSDNSEFVTSKEEIKNACMYMAQWKDKQMIEKTCKWLEGIAESTGYDSYDVIESYKKAMEE